MEVVLRPAAAGDALRIAEVLLSSRKTFQPYAPPVHTDAEVREWVRDMLMPAGGVTVACVNADIAAMMATSRAADAGWIEQLFVVPGATGQGIGALLLDHALATLPRPVRLYTFQANSGARRFYERRGFRAIAFGDGSGNEEHCPDVLYELAGPDRERA